jgi:hypothetical protein
MRKIKGEVKMSLEEVYCDMCGKDIETRTEEFMMIHRVLPIDKKLRPEAKGFHFVFCIDCWYLSCKASRAFPHKLYGRPSESRKND